MPFHIPGKIQEWIERRNARTKTQRLMAQIAEVNGLLQDKKGSISALVREHVERAEERYKQALSGYEGDELSECHRQTEFGLFRLELAKDHLAQPEDAKYEPDFEDGTGEHAVMLLSAGLVETKMAIEYSNCVVSEVNRKNLVGVVTMFHDCIEMLKEQQHGMAKRNAEGALLMLYLLEREIELDNRQSIVQLKSIPKLTAKQTRYIKELVDKIASSKQVFRDAAFAPSTRVLKHVDSAVDNFYNAVQAYVDDDVARADKLCATASMQCEFAQRLFRGDNSSRSKNKLDSTATHEYLERELKTFRVRAQKLMKLALMKPEHEDFVRDHLYQAAQEYIQAQNHLATADFATCLAHLETARTEIKSIREVLLPMLSTHQQEALLPPGVRLPIAPPTVPLLQDISAQIHTEPQPPSEGEPPEAKSGVSSRAASEADSKDSSKVTSEAASEVSSTATSEAISEDSSKATSEVKSENETSPDATSEESSEPMTENAPAAATEPGLSAEDVTEALESKLEGES